jgi:hypothetical protein
LNWSLAATKVKWLTTAMKKMKTKALECWTFKLRLFPITEPSWACRAVQRSGTERKKSKDSRASSYIYNKTMDRLHTNIALIGPYLTLQISTTWQDLLDLRVSPRRLNRATAGIRHASVPGEQIWGSVALTWEAFAHWHVGEQAFSICGLRCGLHSPLFQYK